MLKLFLFMCLIASGFCAAVFQANDGAVPPLDIDVAESAYPQYGGYGGYGGYGRGHGGYGGYGGGRHHGGYGGYGR